MGHEKLDKKQGTSTVHCQRTRHMKGSCEEGETRDRAQETGHINHPLSENKTYEGVMQRERNKRRETGHEKWGEK